MIIWSAKQNPWDYLPKNILDHSKSLFFNINSYYSHEVRQNLA